MQVTQVKTSHSKTSYDVLERGQLQGTEVKAGFRGYLQRGGEEISEGDETCVLILVVFIQPY